MPQASLRRSRKNLSFEVTGFLVIGLSIDVRNKRTDGAMLMPTGSAVRSYAPDSNSRAKRTDRPSVMPSQNILGLPSSVAAQPQTTLSPPTRSRFRFTAASTNPENSGCAAGGFDLNSG